jgi:hypothetical protein
MKTIEKMGAQGDVMFVRVAELPANAKRAEDKKQIVVSHSETGHAHYIAAIGVERFEVGDPLMCYLRVSGEHADVEHSREVHQHETIRLPKARTSVARGAG